MAEYRPHIKKKDISFYKDLVLNHIPNEPSKTSSKDIAYNCNLKPRDVRFLIQSLRDEGYPICATPESGYWMAGTSFDMTDTLTKLKSHIESCQTTYDALYISYNRLKKAEGR